MSYRAVIVENPARISLRRERNASFSTVLTRISCPAARTTA